MTSRYQIDIRSGVSPEELFDTYVRTSTPVLLRGAASEWPACDKWTPDFLCEKYADVTVDLVDSTRRATRKSSLRDYFCLAVEERSRWYLCDWNFRHAHPELLDDLGELSGFSVDWIPYLPAAQRPDMMWIYIGHAGTRGALHVDNYGTSAWLSVLQGEKWVRFVDANGSIERGLSGLDVFCDDALPDGLRIAEARMEAGDVLFVPAGRRHAALNPTYCLSVTTNFVDGSNFALHRHYWMRGWRGRRMIESELDRWAALPPGVEKNLLLKHLQRALADWTEVVSEECEVARTFADRLRSLRES